MDYVSVRHDIRKVAKYYDYTIARAQMKDLLSRYPHFTNDEAMVVLEKYSK